MIAVPSPSSNQVISTSQFVEQILCSKVTDEPSVLLTSLGSLDQNLRTTPLVAHWLLLYCVWTIVFFLKLKIRISSVEVTCSIAGSGNSGTEIKSKALVKA